MALASVFVVVLLAVSELGLGSALVQREEISLDLKRKTFGFVLVVAVTLSGLLVLFAPFIASFFETPELESILRVMSLSFIIIALSTVPRAILMRDIRFKEQSIVDMCSTLAGGFVTLALALSGYGVWSLVFGNLVTSIVLAGGLIYATRFFHTPIFFFRGIGDILSFGSWTTGAHLMWLFWSQIDVFIVGKLLGQQLLGFYSVGKHIAQLPQYKIQGILNQIAFPAYSKANRNAGNAEYYLEKQIRLTSLVSFPVFLGMSAVSPEIVTLVLGEKWLGAIIPLQILCLGVPMRTLEAAFHPYLMAMGQVRVMFMTMLGGLMVMVLALVGGGQWGLLGVCAGWALGGGAIFLIVLIATAARTAVDVRRILGMVVRTAMPGLLMYAFVLISRTAFEGQSLLLALVSGIFIGAIVYAVLAVLMCLSEIREIKNMFRRGQVVADSANVVE